MPEQAVVMFTERPPSDWKRAALSLANACPGLTYADAARACRYSQGFLELMLAPAQLTAAAAALTTAGCPASVIRTSERISPPPAFTLLRLGIDDLGLSGLEPRSPSFARVPWRRVRLLHLAWVTNSREPAELWFELVLAEPFARLRLRMNAFVCDSFTGSEENLRKVVALIARHAPKAVRTGLVETCLAGGELDASYLDEHENDRAVSWELTRRRLFEGAQLVPAPRPEASPPIAADGLQRTADLLARFRRVALLSTSFVLVLASRFVVLPAHRSWPTQLAIWLPILGALTLAYVGVQMGIDTMKERRRETGRL
ncbi:MAG: hypothetical protein Q8K32_11295 [Archangium sp.]|nr:hypothetical protein [Archangium sp.]